ncbi:hypothetical protein AB0I77_29595 [Streptomyces sp. NPDC050619]|uniref:hypothetical protein n=1 Tax=Streptomyces sp. NPDC050619 TaxID=3157214 RepID=UPI003412D21F
MTRAEALQEAIEAAARAKKLAADVERNAHHADRLGSVPRLAAAGATWADTARAYAAIAAVLPETTTED